MLARPMLEFADWVMATLRDSKAAETLSQVPHAA